jgi:hypothetical protein
VFKKNGILSCSAAETSALALSTVARVFCTLEHQVREMVLKKIDTFRDIALGHTNIYRISIKNVRRCPNVFHESFGEKEENHATLKISVYRVLC